MDFVLINKFLHWKVVNKEKLSDVKRITFMETLIDQMINENIPNLMRRHENRKDNQLTKVSIIQTSKMTMTMLLS